VLSEEAGPLQEVHHPQFINDISVVCLGGLSTVIADLTFCQGHRDLNPEMDACSQCETTARWYNMKLTFIFG
jgi:hypothetical protein